MVDAVSARLDPASVRLSTPVSGLEKVEGGWKVAADGVAEFYDAVILASPAWAAGALLGAFGPALPGETQRYLRFAYSGLTTERIREGLSSRSVETPR